MTTLSRIRVSIVVLRIGAAIYWAWGDVARAIGDASFSPTTGLDEAHAEIDRYHCAERSCTNALYGACDRRAAHFDGVGEEEAFYARHRAALDARANVANNEARSFAFGDALGPAL